MNKVGCIQTKSIWHFWRNSTKLTKKTNQMSKFWKVKTLFIFITNWTKLIFTKWEHNKEPFIKNIAAYILSIFFFIIMFQFCCLICLVPLAILSSPTHADIGLARNKFFPIDKSCLHYSTTSVFPSSMWLSAIDIPIL